ncbi:MAG: nucleotidyltransferase [bacterium]
MVHDPDFREFIQLLNANRVEYLLVGGYAVVLHGYPRLTGDMDIWVRPSTENAERVLATLDDFGVGSLGFKLEDFNTQGKVNQLGVPPLRIDVITAIDGVTFEVAYGRRNEIEVNGVKISLISLEDLLTNKKKSGRPKDIDDLDNLTEQK